MTLASSGKRIRSIGTCISGGYILPAIAVTVPVPSLFPFILHPHRPRSLRPANRTQISRMAGAETKKVSVNGSTSGYNPSTQDEINHALVASGGVRRIQEVFERRLDEVGWTQHLRDYVERLFRSGEATTYDEALRAVTQHISLQSPSEEGRMGELTIPRDVAKDAAESVKKELKNVVEMEK